MDFAETHLLDFSKDFDVTLLDQIILIAYDGKHPNRSAANDFLVRMKDHPDMWKRADAILESSKQSITKQFGLQILESAICTRWKILPLDQREGIRNYVISKIMALSSDENTSSSKRTLGSDDIALIKEIICICPCDKDENFFFCKFSTLNNFNNSIMGYRS